MMENSKRKTIDTVVSAACEVAIESELGNLAKGGFIASLDHLLRNPMNSILGMLSLLKESGLDDNQLGYVNSALEASGYLMHTIDNITDFQLDSNDIDLKDKPFDLFKAGKNVIQALSGVAASKNIALQFEYGAETPTIFLGDALKLQQVLAKIMERSILETEKGSVKLDISSTSDIKAGIEVKLSVSSTSCDLSQTPAFSSFDFANAELDGEGRRIKLELAVCQRIVERMGGNIDVASSCDGSNGGISLHIPFREPSASKLEQIAHQREGDKPSKSSTFKKTFNGIHVLLAEDDQINQSLAVAFLTKLGGAIDTADNGQEAFDKFRERDYDIVLLDCEMPVMNGFDAAQKIRKFEKESGTGRKTPIIAMTAYAARGDRENCLAAGMDDHVPKPITLDLLTSIAENHIFQNR